MYSIRVCIAIMHAIQTNSTSKQNKSVVQENNKLVAVVGCYVTTAAMVEDTHTVVL